MKIKKIKKVNRNHTVITALVAMVCVAGYLNYSSKGLEPSPILLNDEGEIAALVPSLEDEEVFSVLEVGEEVSETEETEPGEAIFVNASVDSSYFVEAKLDREQARAKQKEILMSMINSSNIESDKRSEVADEMLKIQERIEKETAAEAMIESKGFNNVYVRIDDDTVDVVVSKSELTDAEIAQIEDIVKRKTGVESDQIRISAMKK